MLAHREKKKTANIRNISRLDFIPEAFTETMDCQERDVVRKETREESQAPQEHPHSEGEGHLQNLVTH